MYPTKVMYHRTALRLLLIASLSGAAPFASGAATYAVRTEIVSYGIYDDPSDEQNRELIYWIVLYLSECDSDVDSIGWCVTKIKIIEFNDAPTADRTWADNSPTVATGDGLWWVDHADFDDPQPDEFLMPPFIDGTAEGVAQESDLDYEFEGKVLPTEEDYFTATAALTLDFWLNQTPLINRTAEPVEVEMDDELPL